MTDKLLLRDIPHDLKQWIENESYLRRVSQKNFILEILSEVKKNQQLSLNLNQKSYKSNAKPAGFKFIDLFAGIGGFRIGLERQGGECVWSSEWDKYSQKTYYKWFGDMPAGDITEVDAEDIPDHDILSAGFPCQPFSIAGVSKKISLGRDHGFKDKKQGNLFFKIAEILKAKNTPVAFLENVKNLKSHDKGKTWSVIQSTLESLGYKVFSKIIDAAYYVPQHRERIFIVAFKKSIFGEDIDFNFPDTPKNKIYKISDILEDNVPEKYTLSDHLWRYLQNYADKHKAMGNGFGFGLVNKKGISRTLSARYYKDGSEILIPQLRRNPRRLTPREAARLMGYPDNLPIVVSDTQAYKQFGNSVVVPVVSDVARAIVRHMIARGQNDGFEYEQAVING